MARISVIVPMYNVEQFVGDCIVSLRAQTFEDFEAICVDDGSTDETAERARRAAAGDPRFVFAERPNGGLSAARNTGLDRASGEYVCFLDSDDTYAPATLEALYQIASAGNLDVVDFSACAEYESEQAFRAHEEDYSYRTPVRGVWNGQELFAHYWQEREYIAAAWCHFVRRSFLEAEGLRFGEGLLHEDELFTPMLYAHAQRVAFVNEPYYRHRIREDSIMTRRRTMRNVHSLFRISQLLHGWAIEHAHECDSAYLDALAQDIAYIRDAAFVALQEVDPADAEAYLAGLDAQQRLDFDLTIRYVSDQPNERIQALMDSRTYRAGSLLVAAPRALRDLRDRFARKRD